MALLTLTAVAKTYDANRPLLREVSFSVRDEDRIGLIGANGSGKSTLLRIVAGLEVPDGGQRTVRRGTRIGYLEQEPEFPAEATVREIVRAGLEGREALLAEMEELHGKLALEDGAEELERLLRRQARLQERLDELGGHDIEHRVEATIDGVGLPDPDQRCGVLSGGEARRVALARLLLQSPDLLLLDEPTNHLDAFVAAWLEERLAQLKVPLVLVTHDRYLLDRVAERIVEIDRGRAYEYPGNYSDFVGAKAARVEAEERAESSRLNLLRREAAWMRRGPPARTTKAKARVSRFEELVADAPDATAAELELAFPKGPRLGNKGILLRGVEHSYGDRRVLPPLDLEITAGMRLGIVGPNGAGKSTLLSILLGRLEPSAGEVIVGETVRTATVDQKRSDLDRSRTVVQEVAGAADHVLVGDRRVHVASFLERFLFPGPKKEVRVGDLSGGERGRILLAKLFLQDANVLVLDEPTNDLDLMTLRALEEALCAFPGAVVVVSHDRWFLDRVATHVLHLDGQGGTQLYTGDASALLEGLGKGEKERRERGKGTRPKPTPAAATAQGNKRLSPWERRELEQISERITELEQEETGIHQALSDPTIYTDDRPRVQELQKRQGELGEELSRSLARWEELAEREE